MVSRQLDEEAIFHTARKIENRSACAEYLDQICEGDANLRSRVEALLEVHENEQDFFKSAAEPAPTLDQSPISERPGHQIGRYKLLQKIGEGGFGVVYMAEQQRPVRRKVALKIIKPGMDTRAVVARFEAERQALALMDHPNIARVLDGGATDSGRPYFVMELVRGVPVTEYCDKNQVATGERLELFIKVCQAVQHAHQKGIIHRDLKPSNIMVTLHDGHPVVKVIDFGVSKAINQQLTEKTLFTAYGQMIGTPQYMSPEQAEMSGLDVDTRSDIYSLGVLLYELLTDSTPLTADRLHSAGYAEMQRLIREDEPPRPSTRLSSSGERLTIIAKHRGATPERLHREIKGDLDWIVMKALAKDRGRRYETAINFAADVGRFLHNEPIEARAPSARYRIQKFVARNKGLVAGTAIIAVALIAGICGTTSGWLAARRSQRQATDMLASLQLEQKQSRERLHKWQDQIVNTALAEALSGNEASFNKAIKDAELAKVSQTRIDLLRGLAAVYAGKNEEAVKLLKGVVDQQPGSVEGWALLKWSHDLLGNLDELGHALATLRDMEPKNDYDRLFKGYAEYGMKEGLEELQFVVNKRPTWPVARIFLAHALARLAVDTGNAQPCEEAIRHLDWAGEALEENPFLAAVELHVLTVAIVLSGEKHEGSAKWCSRASDVADGLKNRSPDYIFGRIVRALYLTQLGERVDAMAEWKRVVSKGGGSWAEGIYVALLLQENRFEEAATLTAFSFEAPALAGDRAEALRRCGEASSGSMMDRLWAQYIRCLCGEPERARTVWQAMLRTNDPMPWWITNALRLFTEEISPHELLNQVNGDRSLRKAHAHLLISAYYLANGQRESATESLDRCIAANSFMNDFHYWALAYRERLNDPTWPKSLKPVLKAR